MTDFAKIQKLLNLCSSASDAEALASLRLAQKLSSSNLGDLIASANGLATSDEAYYRENFQIETEKLSTFKRKFEDLDKKLKKRERENEQLKRQNKDLSSRFDESEKARLALLDSAAKSQTPGEYQILEKLYEEALVRNDRLKEQLSDRDKSVKKGMRDLSKLKRGQGSNEGRVEELEKMVNDLALEVMDLRDRERARSHSSP